MKDTAVGLYLQGENTLMRDTLVGLYLEGENTLLRDTLVGLYLEGGEHLHERHRSRFVFGGGRVPL